MSMWSVLTGIAVMLTPVAVTVALLALFAWRERRREMAIARQIEITDAIHRELGAVTAPTVRPGTAGSWQVSMAVPVDRPDTLGALVQIADRVISRGARASGRRVRIEVRGGPEKEAA